MNIQRISSQQMFRANKEEKSQNKHSALDKFHTAIVNSADMSDTIEVPRTIFKGYMAFTVATGFSALAAALKKHQKTSTVLATLSALTAVYGTFSFVRPFLLRDVTPAINKTDKTQKTK